MDTGLRHRVVLITGGTRGIGRETAQQFARESARVVITFAHDRGAAECVLKEIMDLGGDGITVPLDLSSPDSIQRAIEQAASQWGTIGVLVNNAFQWGEFGRDDAQPFEKIPPENWRPLLRTAIEGVMELTQGVLPILRSQGWGRIVNVSATIGADGLAGYSWYSAAKAALHGFTKTLALETGGAGVLVNCVLPGLTRTDRIRYVHREMQRMVARQTPIQRLLEPSDIASMIVYLGSAANTAVTGQLIRVSGGL